MECSVDRSDFFAKAGDLRSFLGLHMLGRKSWLLQVSFDLYKSTIIQCIHTHKHTQKETERRTTMKTGIPAHVTVSSIQGEVNNCNTGVEWQQGELSWPLRAMTTAC